MKRASILTAVAIVALSVPGFSQSAQTAPPAPPTNAAPPPAARQAAPPPGTAAHRSQRQQQRIAQGVHSGQLTAGETRNLENREASVNRERRDMRAHNGGRLSARDRRAINRRQNHISHSIYRDKHNGARR
jgi:hypothetical protein